MRTGGSIALATLISRITGFVRTVMLVGILGGAISSAFQAAYVLPNMIAEVVLGAVLTAIVIPVLVRAEAEDPDGGEGFVNRIYTLTLVILSVATVVALVAAPAYSSTHERHESATRPRGPSHSGRPFYRGRICGKGGDRSDQLADHAPARLEQSRRVER